MAAAAPMTGGANQKLADARQDCLDALAAHAALHDAAQALGLFDMLDATQAAQAHAVLGALTANQNTTAHSAITNALTANRSVTVDWQAQDAGLDVAVETSADGSVLVVFKCPHRFGH